MPDQPKWFALVGYVTPAGDFLHSSNRSPTDFYSVWIASPDGCETAVVEARGEYWVVDLLNVMQKPNKKSGIGADFFVGTYTAFPTEAAAVMAAMMMRT